MLELLPLPPPLVLCLLLSIEIFEELKPGADLMEKVQVLVVRGLGLQVNMALRNLMVDQIDQEA